MDMFAQGKIMGYKFWVSADKQLDVGSVFLESTLKNSKKHGYGGENGEGFSRGVATHEYKCHDSAVIKKIKHLECPFTAQLVIDSETDGKGVATQVVMDIRPTPVEPVEQPSNKKAA